MGECRLRPFAGQAASGLVKPGVELVQGDLSSQRDRRPPLPAAERYRMRRLTDDEMSALCELARDGRPGPARALDALWDLILIEAEGVSVAEAAARPGSYRVQDYAMAADQYRQLLACVTERRRLPPKVVAGFHQLWAMHSPSDYED